MRALPAPHGVGPAAAQRPSPRPQPCAARCPGSAPMLRQASLVRPPLRAARPQRRVAAGARLSRSSTKDVLSTPPYVELMPHEVTAVFGLPRDFEENYIVGKKIGAGSFGVVSLVIHKRTGRSYASKAIPKVPRNKKCTSKYLKKLQNEVDSMRQLGSSLSAVFLQDAFEDDHSIYLVMELCEGGGLLDRLKSGALREKDVSRIMKTVLQFLAQCHSRHVVYRDVKPDNFLFLTKEHDSPLKATDFGLAIRWRPGDDPMTTRSGTPVYMAPEVVMQQYNEKCDTWSAGMLMFQLLTGRWPFWEDLSNMTLQDVFRSILQDDIDLDNPDYRDKISPPARDLLSKLLERDSEVRLSAVEALSHPWVSEVDVASNMPLAGSVVQRLQRFATYGHLKQLILGLIAEKMQGDGKLASMDHPAHQEMLEAIQGLYDEMNVGGGGALTLLEMTEGLARQGYNITEEEVRQLVERIDIDEDGSLQYGEWLAGLIDWDGIMEDDQWVQYVGEAFRHLDRDGDGRISADELLDLIPARSRTTQSQDETMQELSALMREADTNSDGEISEGEFFRLMTRGPLPDALVQYDARIARTQSVMESIDQRDVPADVRMRAG
ncbi:unnamed protein product [Pedinophyceae sp. YPF-701]|nr:unnamed protein product [Pedinophyceae sp. YPF-701]